VHLGHKLTGPKEEEEEEEEEDTTLSFIFSSDVHGYDFILS
jgi:hypothetical protein